MSDRPLSPGLASARPLSPGLARRMFGSIVEKDKEEQQHAANAANAARVCAFYATGQECIHAVLDEMSSLACCCNELQKKVQNHLAQFHSTNPTLETDVSKSSQ